MYFRNIAITALFFLHVHLTCACYHDCTNTFNQKIAQLIGVSDSRLLTQKSCEATSEQITCLQAKESTCDARSLQIVNSILGIIRPDYERTCIQSSANANNTGASFINPTQQLLVQCSQRGKACYNNFNQTFIPALHILNISAICVSLEEYSTCADKMVPECGQFMGPTINAFRSLYQQYSVMCSTTNTLSSDVVMECVNRTMDCYVSFNSTFTPALLRYTITEMCRSTDTYVTCLQAINAGRPECQTYTSPALRGSLGLKQQYAVYCSTDGGQKGQQCVAEFQSCYVAFNQTFFPAVYTANMDVMCSSVAGYAECAQKLVPDCGQQLADAIRSVRMIKDQYTLQCDKDFQRMSTCRPLGTCVQTFLSSFTSMTSITNFCSKIATYFPCVESSLQECNITTSNNSISFSRLGDLTGGYCSHLLSDTRMSTCPELIRCTAGSRMSDSLNAARTIFEGAAWCTYMDMMINCADRALITSSCDLANDAVLRNHVNSLRESHKNTCTTSSPDSTPTDALPVTQKGDKAHLHGHALSPSSASGVFQRIIPLVFVCYFAVFNFPHQ